MTLEPDLWKVYDGITQGEEKHPGPAHSSNALAPNTSWPEAIPPIS